MKKISSIKNLISISYGEIIGFFSTGFFWFWLATQITPENYGQLHFFIGIAGITGYIANIGTTSTITVYTAKNIPIVKSLLLFSSITSFLGFIIIYFLYQRIDVGFLVIGYVLNFIAMGQLLGKKKYFTQSKYILIQKILTLVLGVLFYYLFGIEGIIFSLAITYIFFIIPIYKEIKIEKFELNQFKNRMRFILSNYLMQVISGFTGQLDKIIVVPILGFTLLGNYSLALSFLAILLFLPNNMFKYLLSEEANGKNNKKISIFSVILSVIIVIIAIITLPRITDLFFPEFTEVNGLIQIMSIGIIPKTISSIYEATFLAQENSKYVLYGRISHLTTMTISMILLGTSFGIIGIGIAFILTNCIKTILLFSLKHKNKILNL